MPTTRSQTHASNNLEINETSSESDFFTTILGAKIPINPSRPMNLNEVNNYCYQLEAHQIQTKHSTELATVPSIESNNKIKKEEFERVYNHYIALYNKSRRSRRLTKPKIR